ncbi:MAG: hypothetical protein HC933_16040 [Pleurocapsa sp. SU_196_0]|nr:hypothetical protein [Pleurocapsa sp. SU_196_0]
MKRDGYNPRVSIETLHVTDETFDDALERFAVIDETLVLKTDVKRPLKEDEPLDRYGFTAFVEALRSDEFTESPFDIAADLELEREFHSEDDAWNAILDFYAARACVLLIVGETEEFIVGREIAVRLGLLESTAAS